MPPTLRGRHAPMLVCLNLQRGYITPQSTRFLPRAREVLVQIQACLAWARRQGTPVIHVHTIGECGAQGDQHASIAGLEPLLSEPLIFKRTASFLESRELPRAGVTPQNCDALVLGFTGIRDCVAAAVDADRVGARLIFICDAIASPDVAPHPAADIDTILQAVLGQFAGLTTTRELFSRAGIAV